MFIDCVQFSKDLVLDAAKDGYYIVFDVTRNPRENKVKNRRELKKIAQI